MNRVQLVGVVLWPVEARRDRMTGQTMGRAVIAVLGDVQDLHFVPLTLQGKDATDAATYLGEGSRVAVNGHLHSVLVRDRDWRGTRRTRRVLSAIADRVTYLAVRPPHGGDRP
jgi:single-stranded DNA-binding protein